jgi:hypothetical protein
VRRIAALAALVLGALAASLDVLPAGFAPKPVASAQDKKKGDDKKDKEQEEKEKREREKKKREKVLTAIGNEFGQMDTTGILNRVPKGSKVHLTLPPDVDGPYAAGQARGVLDAWFDKFQTIDVSFTSSDDNVGSYKVKLRKKGKDDTSERTLQVTIGSADAGYPLTMLVVQK